MSYRIVLYVAFYPRQYRLFAGMERFSRYRFVHLNVAPRKLLHKLEGRLGERRVLIRVAVLLEPQAQEFLIEIFRLLAFRDAFFIASELPIAGRVRRMYLVDKNKLPVLVGPEFVFRIYENQAALCRKFLSARDKRESRLLHLFEPLRGYEPFSYHLCGR